MRALVIGGHSLALILALVGLRGVELELGLRGGAAT